MSQELPELLVYTKVGCGQCVGAKMFLNQKGIPYKLINVDTDELREEIRALGAQSFPFIVSPNGKTSFGFKPEELKEIVKELGY